MSGKKSLFFIALLPPPEVQEFVTKIKQHFAEVYHSRAALKSPPHITLQPPFEWEIDQLPLLQEKLTEFAQNRSPIPIILHNYSAFKPRVIYINVFKTDKLLAAEEKLTNYLEESLNIVHLPSKNRPFSPHLTVAYRDLNKENFYKAWEKFQGQELHFEFRVNHLTLLKNTGVWTIYQEFFFALDDRW